MTAEQEEEAGIGAATSGDTLYDQAVAIVTRDGRASTSGVQRRLQIGYNRAARLIEQMEDEGVISAPNHAGKREVLLANSEQRRQKPPHYRLAPPNWPNLGHGLRTSDNAGCKPARAASLADINAALADSGRCQVNLFNRHRRGNHAGRFFSRPARPLPVYLHARRTQCRDFARQLLVCRSFRGGSQSLSGVCHATAPAGGRARRASGHRNWNPSPKKAARLKSPCATQRATFRGVWF